MQVLVKSTIVEFSGILNESSSKLVMHDAISDAMKNMTTEQKIYIDFSAVKRANSVGLLYWSSVISQFRNIIIVYINIPVWLVEQLNLCTLLSFNAYVESMISPFYCIDNDTYKLITLHIIKDIPLLDNYSNFELHLKTDEGLLLEQDFESIEYFNFLSLNKKRFEEYFNNK